MQEVQRGENDGLSVFADGSPACRSGERLLLWSPEVAGTYAGAAHGAYKIVTRTGTFDEGFETTYKMTEAEEFSDKHGEQLTGAAITAATTVMKGQVDKHNKHTPPSS